MVFGEGLNGIVTGGDSKRAPVILTHGAGQGMQSPLLAKTASRLGELGFVSLRFNFAYIDKKSAPSAGGKREQPDLVSAIEYMKQFGNPILVGKSFGARVCADVALRRHDIEGLVFYGMPLQGASPTAKPRDWSHLACIKPPVLFITGDKDKLCPLDRLAVVLATMSGDVTSEIVAGDHSFKPKSEDAAMLLCTNWIDQLAK
ncbi:MAG: hypothetical protein K2W95_16155 [Candidatus Obscuribacterales bacterium]|nr:hypothetical protein [Candidatus Obscuribacterales bacterium]